ncbi:hypothetical protein CCR87_13875 [Rhodobaculum claviforme]|uniref:DUF427 domain-containing protein n=2 Tax=Rhodobaculum claviforme TaxID=1549854 RepID=A0A934TN99_9RHOB|nr:DUF427 domain-containing protein [Rhodobaculum claviforme]MBK5928407.1 hypothetical protein [Rhodobaculum claviforme]
MTTQIRIDPAEGCWVARAEGAIIAESRAALMLTEGARAPVIYFPRADVAMAFLEPSARVTRCPHKGETAYFSIMGPSATVPDAAWSYEAPLPGVAGIAGAIAFDPALVTVERI